MTKAMLIYSYDIYTHIEIWVSYVYVCLQSLSLSDRSSQNTEPHYGVMISLKHISFRKCVLATEGGLKRYFFFTQFDSPFCCQTQRAKRVGGQDVQVLCYFLIFSFTHIFLPFFVSDP